MDRRLEVECHFHCRQTQFATLIWGDPPSGSPDETSGPAPF